MGRGRAPCCDKIGLKKGPWTPAEDMKLISFIHKHGHTNWRALPKQAGLLRCGKSCRLRWINYLRPDIKRGNFTPEEEETIIKLHESLGNKWSVIASKLPGRTDNEIKNVWNTHLKKRSVPKQANPPATEPQEFSTTSSSSSSSSGSSITYSKHGIDMDPAQQTCQPCVSHSFSEVHDMVQKQDHPMTPLTIESKVNIWDMLDEPKELSCSSSSDSSSESHLVDANQNKGLKPVEEACSNSNSQRPCEVHKILQEVHKQEPMEVVEIPFDPNLDFWDMLDSTSYPFNEIPSSGVEANKQSTSEKEDEKEVESKGWVQYLETELGLQPNDTFQPLISDFFDDKILLEAEIDPVATYFQMESSSPPHSFCL